MTRHAAARKSSFTLPADEHARVLRLRKILGVDSNTEVIRRSLLALEESVSREMLRKRFRDAVVRLGDSTAAELEALDGLSLDGLEDVPA